MIAKDYLEAADIFGAGLWQKVRLIIFPLLKPSIQSALIIRTLLAFQVFGPIVVLAGRLFPVMASESYFWYTLIRNEHVAAAYALLLMVISIITTWSYLVLLRPERNKWGIVMKKDSHKHAVDTILCRIYIVAVLIALWTLAPFILIAFAAFTSRANCILAQIYHSDFVFIGVLIFCQCAWSPKVDFQ